MFEGLFFQLSSKNSDQIIPDLLRAPEIQDMSSLIPLLNKASVIRPFSLIAYADLAIKAISENNIKMDLLSSLLNPDSEYPGSIVLTYHLWKKGFYSDEEVTNYIFDKYQHFGNYKSRYLFVIFSQLIKDRNRDLFEHECHSFYMTYAISGFSNIFTSFFESLPSMSKEEVKSLIKAPYGDVGNAIVNDNVDYLRANNIDPKGHLTPSFFMATDLAQQSPTYLQWSAFCSAENCFNFLLEAGADPQAKDRQGRSSLQYAAAGGNLTILRELQNIVPDMDRAKETANEYENLEVFKQI